MKPLALVLALCLCACERETRDYRSESPRSAPDTKRLTNLQAGPATYYLEIANPYEGNAHAIAEGARLFEWMNCVGCHAHGGGAIGPALMDDQWIYGSEPQNIFASIVEGRPNGMPSFRGKLTEKQVWQLVSYVQALSGNVPKDAAPGRPDSMQVKLQEAAKEREKPSDGLSLRE